MTSHETPEYIMRFARAISPDYPDLLLSKDERGILTLATQRISALEAERDAWRTNSERWGRDWRRVVEERDALRAKLARAVHELGITAAQRTSYEVIEEEGGDEYSDYRRAYDIIIEQTRKALAAIEEEV